MIEIYGKPNCGYCNMAKQICESKGLDFVYKSLDVDYKQDEFFEKFPAARTFPQIIMDGEAIGGFTELRDKL
jgi:glutaredoxin 3